MCLILRVGQRYLYDAKIGQKSSKRFFIFKKMQVVCLEATAGLHFSCVPIVKWFLFTTEIIAYSNG
jgi:hypothetical protein